ncbi:MAG: zinc ribbon domain-containing protein [Roseburia sp.]|nr:zinc ribbon domain-containing protein [Roseburia sp.]
MALIRCSECGKEISDKASSCPSCGYPISNNDQMGNEIKRQWKQKKIFKILLSLTVICIVCWTGMYLWQQCNASDISSARASGYASSISWMTGISSYQSASEKNLVKIDNFVKTAKKVVAILIIFFGILSVHYYILTKKKKNN